MNRITFAEIDNVITEVANGIFGYQHTKEKTQKLLFQTIYLACKEYESNPDFKEKIELIVRRL